MSRATRSSSVSNINLTDCSAMPEKADTRTKKNISKCEVVKSTISVSTKFTLNKATDSNNGSYKQPIRTIRTMHSRSLGVTKHSDKATSNQGTLSQKARSGQINRSIDDKGQRNEMIKVEPFCNQTVTRTFRNRSSITKTKPKIGKPPSTIGVNTSKNLGVASRHSFGHYTSVGDLNSQGLFNPLNFTTVCAIDSINFGFACLSCRMVRFKTLSELRLHEDWCGCTTRDDKFYKCGTCERKYHSPTVLSRHEGECKQDKSQVEKKESANPFDFTTIFAPDFRDFPFFCTSCHIVSFRTLDEMRVHENWCGIVLIGLRDSVICENCGITFRNTTVLAGHRQGPPGCTRENRGRQKRSLSPLKNTKITGIMDSKRRKLNQSVTSSKMKNKFTVVLCSKRKRISQKSVASYDKTANTSGAIKVEQSSLDSSIEYSPKHEHRTMQETKKEWRSITTPKDDSTNYSRKSISASQSEKNELDVEDMIFESAISGADQASCVPGYQDTENNSCPVCDLTIVGSIDDMCLHFQQFHNLAFSADSRYSSRYVGRVGPTNCLDCNTLFDTRLEMTRHKQICTKNKQIRNPSVPRFICAICPATSVSREEFNAHVQTFHGGVDEYQKILLGKTKLYRRKPGVSNLPPERVSENTNKQSLANEIKPEIFDEANNSPVLNNKVLGVIVPVKLASRQRTLDISSGVEVSQKSVSYVSNKTSNIDQVVIKKSTKDSVVHQSDFEKRGEGLSKTVLENPSIAASETDSSLRVEDMVASVTVNRSLRTEGSEGCVGKINNDNNPADLQSNPKQDITKKLSNPQLPVVFNTSALQNIFLKKGRRRLHLQTSLLPGSEIVVVGTEVDTPTTLKAKCPNNNKTQTNDSKLRENINQNKLVKTGAKPTSVIDNTEMTPTGVLNASVETEHRSILASIKDAKPSGIDEDEQQKRLLLALQLVPSSSVHSAENNDDAPVVRKSKRQMARQIDSVEKTTVEKRAMEMIAHRNDINLNPGISKLNKDIKAKQCRDSELVNTSSIACKSVGVSVSLPRLSAYSISGVKLGECNAIGELSEAKEQNRQVRGPFSLGNHQERKKSSSGETTRKESASGETRSEETSRKESFSEKPKSLALLSRSEDSIERQSEPVVSLPHDERSTVPSTLLLSDTLVHSGEGILKHTETLSSDVLSQPTERVSDQTEPKASVSSESIPAKKIMRRNLRILEPIDDETLKCLECGSILCTAIEIISHICPE